MVVGNTTLPGTYLNECSNGFFYCMAQWSSDITGGLFWFFALLSFAVVIFLATLRFGVPRAFGFASFVGMMGGIWLSIMKLTPWWIGSSFIIVGFIGIIVMIVSEK